MSFRRDSQKSRSWNDWLAEHREELARTGVPHGIFEQERYWLYFLEHAAFPGEGLVPRFDISEITPTEAEHLLTFLRHAQAGHSIAQRDLERAYPHLHK